MYEWLSTLDRNRLYTILTVLDGAHKGEKLVLSGGHVVWESPQCGFLSQNIKKIDKKYQNKVFIIEGHRVFCEQIGSPASLVLCGAGYVALAVLNIAKSIGMQVTVVEDRPEFAEYAKKAGADRVICSPFAEGLAQIDGGQDTYFVVVTRGHQYDRECLELILKKPYAYLGMMGSRKRTAAMREDLIRHGNDTDAVAQIHMPIGLKIGAETPEEIAVSVMAEIISVKNQQRKASEYSRDMIAYLSGRKGEGQKKVLATIVEKHGSAPRKAGTKMLILEDGQTIGTVGGGSAEYKVICEAMHIIEETDTDIALMKVQMTGEDVQDMMCGGRMEVLLEKIGHSLQDF